MMDTRWSKPAWNAALDAANEAATSRPRWGGQNGWDAEFMETVSTRLPRDMADKLRQYCEEAHVTRYHLVNFMLRVWMAAWEGIRERR
jgi:hypothetical protein